MSTYNDKALKSVADAVSKIMEASKEKENKFHNKLDKLVHGTFGDSPDEKKMKKEEKELSPKQKAIAKLDHPKHKIDAGDLAKLRVGHKPVKEEKESCEDEAEEAVDKHEKKMHGKKGEVSKHEKEMHKEEIEQLDEYQSKDGVYKHKGTYGTAKGAEYGDTDWDKENKDAKKMTKPTRPRKYGARQNYVRGTSEGNKKTVRESFTAMIDAYKEKGLKSLAEMVIIEEEVDSDTYEKEMKDQKDKFDGKKKGADVAKASVQAVKQEEVDLEEAKKMKGEDPCWDSHEMVGMKMKGGEKVPNCVPKNEEVENIDEINGVKIDTIEERTLTEPEMKKKEEVVKSMKKKLSGFKERYGDRAKSVAYATATKIAKEKA
jgi:hypothetical protein